MAKHHLKNSIKFISLLRKRESGVTVCVGTRAGLSEPLIVCLWDS